MNRPSTARRRRRVLLAIVGFVALVATALPLAVSTRPAEADPPDLTFAKSAPGTVLYGTDAAVTLTATNPQGQPGPIYNVSFRDVLPAGVSYVPGSGPFEPQVLDDAPNPGETTLIWGNVGDLQVGSTLSLGFEVRHVEGPVDADNPLPVGSTYTNTAGAYGNSNPRFVPDFDPVTGEPVPGPDSFTTSGTDAASTQVVAIRIAKSEPSPEGELLRGVHDHATVYTLTITNNELVATNAPVVDDYLPANLEFLGCGGVDNTTDAPTFPGNDVEYSGAPRLTGTATPPGCVPPTLVETVLDPPGLPPGVYTHVQWTGLPDLAPGQTLTLPYAAGIPIRANTLTWSSGGTPPTDGPQTANLDNNSGPEAQDEQALTNFASVTGDYQGIFAPGASNPVSDQTELTRTAEDLRIVKGVDDDTVVVGSERRWSLDVAVSEYRDLDNLVITDTVPNGLCPVGGVLPNNAVCGPGAAPAPFDYAAPPVYNPADGTWTVTFDLGALPANGTVTQEFSTLTQEFYENSRAPILAFDDLENEVRIDGDATVRLGADGQPIASDRPDPEEPYPIDDESSAGIGSSWSDIDKSLYVQSGDFPVPPTLTCDEAAGTGDPVRFAPGDNVCFRLTLRFPTTVRVRDALATDFLPANTAFVGWEGLATNTVTVADFQEFAANGQLQWTLGDPLPNPDGSLYTQLGDVFDVVVQVTVSDDPTESTNADLTQNLLKATGLDTAGSSVSLRDDVTYALAVPELDLLKGVLQVTRGGTVVDGPNPPDTDDIVVLPGDVVTYRVDLGNLAPTEVSGAADARNVTVQDDLPPGVTCADVALPSAPFPVTPTILAPPVGPTPDPVPTIGGTVEVATATCSGDVITWTVAVGDPPAQAFQAGTQLTLRYDVTIPLTAAANQRFPNTAEVTQYDGPPGTNESPYVPGQGAVPPAEDGSLVRIANADVDKVGETSVVEPGNNLNSQATIGETATYTSTFVVPANSSVYDATVFDTPFPNGLAYQGDAAITSCPLADCSAFTIATDGNGWRLTFPTPFENATDADYEFEVTATALVQDVGANARGNLKRNTVRYQWDDEDGNRVGNLSDTHDIRIVEPNPRIAKDHTPDGPFVAGDAIDYTLTVTNPANPPANVSTLHDIVVTDCVPDGLTVGTADPPPSGTVTVTPGDPACNGGTGTLITWDLSGDAPDGLEPAGYAPNAAPIVLTYDVTVDTDEVAGTTLTNTADVDGTSLHDNDGARDYNRSTTDEVPLTRATIDKTVDPAQRTIGVAADYTITVTVPDGVRLENARIVDVLPAGMVYVAGSCSDSCTVAGQELTWDLGDVGPGTYVRTYQAYPATSEAAGDVEINTARLTWETPTGTISEQDTAELTVVEPDLDVDKLVIVPSGPDPVQGPVDVPAGTALTYLVRVTNTGTSPAYDVTVTDELPATGTGTPTAISDGGTSSAGPPREITWVLDGPIDVGATVQLSYQVTVDPASTFPPNPSTLTNTASIDEYFGVPDPDDPDRYKEYTGPSDDVTVNVDTPQLAIDKVVGGSDRAEVGDPFPWVVTVTNTGSATAFGVDVVDTLPPNWDYDQTLSITSTLPDTCTAGASVVGGQITWADLCDLQPGGTITIVFTAIPTEAAATTDPGWPNPQVNSATVTGDDAGGDPLPSATDDAEATLLAADLTIVKRDGDAQFVVGVPGTYFLDVSNLGPDAERGPITVTDAIPSGLLATAASGDGWSCAVLGGGTAVECTRPGPLGAGAAAPTITVTVDVFAAAIPSVTNTASVVGTTFDPGPGNNTDTEETPVRRASDFTIDKQLSGPIVPGAPAAWVLTVTNLGPSPASGLVAVTDPLPAGTALSALPSGSGWDCSFSTLGTFTQTDGNVVVTSSGNVDCRRTVIELGPGSPPWALEPITVPFIVDSAVTQVVVNTATVNGPDDPNPDNDTSTAQGQPDADADLVIDKEASPSTFTVGQPATYAITVTNVGVSDEQGPVTVTDPLPTGLSFVSATGTGWSCGAAAGTVTCVSGVGGPALPLPPGATLPQITVTVDVGPEAAPLPDPPDTNTVVNTATVQGTTDPTPDTDTEENPVIPVAELVIDKTHDGAAFTVGGQGAFRLVVTNLGPSAEGGPVTVTDDLPTGLTASEVTGAGWSCSILGGGTAVECTRPGPVAAGAVLPEIVITVDVEPEAAPLPDPPDINTVVNPAEVVGTTDPSPGTDTDEVPIVPQADLAIEKVSVGDFNVGQEGTYRITVRNDGPNIAGATVDAPITITDTIPDDFTFVSATGDGWVCDLVDPDLTCERAEPLAVGAETTIDLTVFVTPEAVPDPPTAVIENTASVTGPTPDPEPENNTDTDETEVTASADLAIRKFHSGAFVVGEEGTFVLEVTNNGPSPALAPTTVTDTIPDGLTAVSATGTGWDCDEDAAVVTCTTDQDLAVGAVTTITLVVRVDADAEGVLVNEATVGGTLPDPDPDNNTDTDLVPITPVSDLQLIKDLRGSLVSGQEAVWRIVVRNDGPSFSPGPIVVTDNLPNGLAYAGFSGSGWSCTASGQRVTCTRSAGLASGESAPDLLLRTRVNLPAGSTVTNVASVDGPNIDPDPGNNTDTATGGVSPGPATSTTTSTTSTTVPTTSTTVPPTVPTTAPGGVTTTTIDGGVGAGGAGTGTGAGGAGAGGGATGALAVTGAAIAMLAGLALTLMAMGVSLRAGAGFASWRHRRRTR